VFCALVQLELLRLNLETPLKLAHKLFPRDTAQSVVQHLVPRIALGSVPEHFFDLLEHDLQAADAFGCGHGLEGGAEVGVDEFFECAGRWGEVEVLREDPCAYAHLDDL
jgi:hypothetical protein